MAALDQLRWLEVLDQLPYGFDVEVQDLSQRSIELLGQLPSGCVESTGARVTKRVVERVLLPAAMLISAETWRSGLTIGSRFAGYGERWLRLPDGACDDPLVRLEAQRFGFGLLDGETVVHRPRPHHRVSWSARDWWFSERVYRQYLGAESMLDPTG